jgi:plastocyanin
MENEGKQQEEKTSTDTKGKNMMVPAIIVVLVIGLLIALFVYRQGYSPATTTAPSSQQVTGVPTTAETVEDETMKEMSEDESMMEGDEAMMEDEGVTEIVIEGSEFTFDPETFTVGEGETVKIVFRNTGTMIHDFVIDEFNVATSRIAPGEEEAVEFTPNQTGSFNFYCSVGNHRALGMEGTLVVE